MPKKKEQFAVGVDLGGTNVKVGIVSDRGKIVRKLSVKSNAKKGPDAVISQVLLGINEILTDNKLKIKDIGIGAPGVVTSEKGIVENPPNFPGWGKINLGKIIRKKINKDVIIENDANAAAIGEMLLGAGKKYSSFIMVTLGTGVGGGIILNRKLFKGEYGGAGEIGHTTIDFNGSKCNCGSIGCIETYVGNSYLVNRTKNELKDHPDSEILKIINKDLTLLTPKIIQEAAELNDEYALSVIKNMGIYLGAAIASVANLLDISTFIIGGGVAGFGKPLFDSIKESATSRVLISLKKRIEILPAFLKNDAGILGASSLVFYES